MSKSHDVAVRLMYSALQVIVKDKRHRGYLLRNDPNAFFQAQDALSIFDGTETIETIVPHFCWEDDCAEIVDAPRSQERVYCRKHSILKEQV
jgi:hypothetical protein